MSDDLGVALCYIFIFIIMAYVGGVNFMWFLAGFGAIAVASPFLWSRMREDQRNRILVIFDETIDPNAQGVRYQMNRSIRALQNGGITGQGLYHGSMVQSGSLPERHNDMIFSSIGEELGLLGCLAVLILLTAIIIRIIHVGIKSGNNMNRLICVGIAGMLASQTIINVGVCLGIFPVVGLTLPVFQLWRRFRLSQCSLPWASSPAFTCDLRRISARCTFDQNELGFWGGEKPPFFILPPQAAGPVVKRLPGSTCLVEFDPASYLRKVAVSKPPACVAQASKNPTHILSK